MQKVQEKQETNENQIAKALRRRRWFLVSLAGLILTMVTIFFFSSQNAEESTWLSDTLAYLLHFAGRGEENASGKHVFLWFSIRKLAHMFWFGVLGLFSYLTVGLWPGSRVGEGRKSGADYSTAKDPFPMPRTGFIAFAFAYVYACTDEFHQLFVEGRSGQISDTGVDAIGIVLAILFCSLITAIVHHKRTK